MHEMSIAQNIVEIVEETTSVLESIAFLPRTVGIHADTYASAEEFLVAYDPEAPLVHMVMRVSR